MLQFMEKWYKAFKEDKAVRLAKDDNINVSIPNANNNEYTWLDAFFDAHAECCEEEQEKAYYK
jgi:hypothetical protein